MKKRIFATLLSVLLATNISTCSFVPKNEIEETSEKPDSTELNFEETDGKTTESETNAEIKPARKSPNFHNGVWGNSNATYTFNQNGEFTVHIADWDEDHLITFLSDTDIGAVKYTNTAIAVNNEHAVLILIQYYEPEITVVRFEKGSRSETVVNLDIDEDVYKISGNFINENIGYIFAFKESDDGMHARGSSKLSNLFQTEDGGITWHSINVQDVPSMDLTRDAIFAKMISEDVGMISGRQGAADYDFCERTLLTTDGGVHWIHITALPQIDCLDGAIEIHDFTLVEGFYILTISQWESGNYNYVKYQSQDLNTWVCIS